ncbi:hypothetical protein ACS2QU_24480 [Bacillus cereus group sp. Bce005]|uniref:hypothetical protein n=1 Tax=Bacillus cereus group sp. Bce005 TaxID=3445256 RepID=UPI003F25D189
MNNFFGVSLKSIQEKAVNTLDEIQRVGNAVINNTMDDAQLIYGGAEACYKELDKVRVRALHRAIEYHTLHQRIMRDLKIIPVELIDKVWRMVFGDIEGTANPRLYQLTNPYEAVWGDTTKRCMKEITDISTHIFPPGRAPFVFVHGAGKRGNPDDAFYFYYYFEREAKMFNNTEKDYSHADIYIVSYDGLITNNTRDLIKTAFESVLGSISDYDAPLLFSAVMWRKWEIRAEDTANQVILPLLKRISDSNIESPVLGSGAITHSLGCYALAYAAQKFIQERPEPHQRPFNTWFCMAAALPANAFTNTGLFPLAPLIASTFPRGASIGTSVWFSNTDLTLGPLYGMLANQHFAMGQTGALVSANDLTNIDVTRCTDIVHDDFEYFPRVQYEIRSALGTERFSEHPPCAITLPTIIDSIS